MATRNKALALPVEGEPIDMKALPAINSQRIQQALAEYQQLDKRVASIDAGLDQLGLGEDAYLSIGTEQFALPPEWAKAILGSMRADAQLTAEALADPLSKLAASLPTP